MNKQEEDDKQREYFAKTLFPRTLPNTTYEDQAKRPCDEGTRAEILADIKTWVYDISDDAQSMFWLSGDPGVGKSAITASIARQCKDDKVLWAQYFINRNNTASTNPQLFFPSIARQMSGRSRVVAFAIQVALEEQPSLTDDISTRQAEKLFVEAIRVAAALNPTKPVVVVIDALDETDTKLVKKAAEIFSQVTTHLPYNAKVFISSRSEEDIRKAFAAIPNAKRVKYVYLDTSDESSVRDVSNFLKGRVAQILKSHDLDPVWPGDQPLQELCNQASGLFIWAVTAAQYIETEIEESGAEHLDDILTDLNTKGMDDINTLYGAVLRRTCRGEAGDWVVERFRRIVGSIVVLQEPLCLAGFKHLLNLRKNAGSNPVDIEHFFRRLRTVLVAGTEVIDDKIVPRLHKSFFDFITSERAGHFRVNEATSHGEIAVQCFRQLTSVRPLVGRIGNAADSTAETPYNSTQFGDYLPAQVRYACQFWSSHLPHVTGAGIAIAGSLKLPEPHELHYLNYNNSLSGVALVIIPPDVRQIVSFWNNAVRVRHIETAAAGSHHWGHYSAMTSVAFSSDGRRVVSSSADKTTRIWDSEAGDVIATLEGHTNTVTSAAFSSDGRRVVSSSADRTIRIWDCMTRAEIGAIKGHSDTVTSAAFSPDGTRVVSSSADRTVRIWDSMTRVELVALEGHSDTVTSAAFSPDGTRVVSSSADRTVRISDSATGKVIAALEGHTDTVTSAAFSPDGTRVVSSSADRTVRISDSATGEVIAALEGHTDTVTSAAFSPDGSRVVSSSADRTVRIWDSVTGGVIAALEGHTDTVTSAAFSPDGSRVVSSSELTSPFAFGTC
jgi:WD40 repeat protein